MELNLDCEEECTILSSHLTLVSEPNVDKNYELFLSCEGPSSLQKFQVIGYTEPTAWSYSDNLYSSYTGQLVCDDLQFETYIGSFSRATYYEITYLPYNVHDMEIINKTVVSDLPQYEFNGILILLIVFFGLLFYFKKNTILK